MRLSSWNEPKYLKPPQPLPLSLEKMFHLRNQISRTKGNTGCRAQAARKKHDFLVIFAIWTGIAGCYTNSVHGRGYRRYFYFSLAPVYKHQGCVYGVGLDTTAVLLNPPERDLKFFDSKEKSKESRDLGNCVRGKRQSHRSERPCAAPRLPATGFKMNTDL